MKLRVRCLVYKKFFIKAVDVFSSLSGRFEVLQKLTFGRGFVLGVELFFLPDLSNEPLLACGGDDARVNLFVRQQGKVK